MKDVGIIGGGPIGLYFATLCEKQHLDYAIFEASKTFGGQLTGLYPEKAIEDIPGIENIHAKDYIATLLSQLNPSKLHAGEKVLALNSDSKSISIQTSLKKYGVKYLIIATGLGFYQPRKMGVEHEDEFPNILYSLNDYRFLTNKRVVIFGGGDSALDWAKNICQVSNFVTLVHRRTEFRGNADTIKKCSNIHLFLPYIPFSLIRKESALYGIRIKEVDKDNYVDLPCDYILVNYGNVPHQSEFPLRTSNSSILVDEKNMCEKRIYCIGDACTYDGKIKRIYPGLKEAEKVFAELFPTL